jgi:uridine phosphorylase
METEPTSPRELYPILEFDPSRQALIEPARTIKPIEAPERCVICFFQETLAKVFRERSAKTIATLKWEDGPHLLHEIEVDGKRLAVLHPGVGAPMASALLEEAIALGCCKFIACGGAGVLDKDIVVGRILVPAAAVRDEGTSYHYLPPARQVNASPDGVAAIERVLQAEQIDYLVSKTWTTDAPYRETSAKIKMRKAEGCLTVEMEAAAFFAVAQFRGVTFAQMLYGGDDVSGSEWNSRKWQSRAAIRERIFWLAAQACLAL